MPEEPDELTPYRTSVETDILIMREIHKITLEERMRPYMEGVAGKLLDAGVDFSKVDFSKVDSGQ